MRNVGNRVGPNEQLHYNAMTAMAASGPLEHSAAGWTWAASGIGPDSVEVALFSQ